MQVPWFWPLFFALRRNNHLALKPFALILCLHVADHHVTNSYVFSEILCIEEEKNTIDMKQFFISLWKQKNHWSYTAKCMFFLKQEHSLKLLRYLFYIRYMQDNAPWIMLHLYLHMLGFWKRFSVIIVYKDMRTAKTRLNFIQSGSVMYSVHSYKLLI